MATGQLWLFPPARPLVERFGEDFFRRLPARPGVYFLCGSLEGVLYVGRAKNLRRRLSSYRVANPERMSRRVIRLLQRTTRIEYDECPDEMAARHREEMLICVLAPSFNRAGVVWPKRSAGLRARRGGNPNPHRNLYPSCAPCPEAGAPDTNHLPPKR